MNGFNENELVGFILIIIGLIVVIYNLFFLGKRLNDFTVIAGFGLLVLGIVINRFFS